MPHSKKLAYIFLTLLVLLLMAISVYAAQDSQEADSIALFASVKQVPFSSQSKLVRDRLDIDNEIASFAVNIAEVKVNQAISNVYNFKPGADISIDLFDEDVIMATLSRVETYSNNVTSMVGKVENSKHGFIITTIREDRVLIVIEIPEKNKQYKIIYDHEHDTHFLYEINLDELDILPGAPPLQAPVIQNLSSGELIDTVSTNNEAGSPGETTIDVMIVYTPAATDWAGANAGSIDFVISQALARAQLTLDNSNTLINLELAHSGEINYTESGDLWTDIMGLTEGTGGFELAHQWRDQYSADLVTMFSVFDGSGGMAWLLNDEQGRPDLGFSIARVQQAHFSYIYIHEIGHNMGAHHHKEQSVEPGPGLFDYSAGWRWSDNDSNNYCTVMTYEYGMFFEDGNDHVAVPHFSNPEIYLNGSPTGHAGDGDNARTLREVREVIAAYRTVEFNDDEDAGADQGSEAIIDYVVVDVDETMVIVGLDQYATAFYEGEENLLFNYLRAGQDMMLVHAICSGTKFVGLVEYAENYMGSISEAINNSEPMPEAEVVEFWWFVEFNEDGSVVMVKNES